MKRRFNTHYEEVYLSYDRLKTSMTPEAEAFIQQDEIRKIITYSSSNSFKKNYAKFCNAGVDIDDVINVARCYTLIFFARYRQNFINEKQRNYSLCRFLGQKIYLYKVVTERKFREMNFRVDHHRVMRNQDDQNEGSILDNLTHFSAKSFDVLQDADREDHIIQTRARVLDPTMRLSTTQLTKLRKIANGFMEKTEEDLKSMSIKDFENYEYQKLAHEVYSKHMTGRVAR